MRLLFTLFFIAVSFHAAIGLSINDTSYRKHTEKYSYAFITIEGKAFSKKLKVEVDLGDAPEQITAGKELSEILTNKKSYAAILNYMAGSHYELVESRDSSYSFQGTGGTFGIIFIMRKRRDVQ